MEQPDQTGSREVRAVEPSACPVPTWTRRLGLGAFLFFLLKGLAWLALPALAMWWRSLSGE